MTAVIRVLLIFDNATAPGVLVRLLNHQPGIVVAGTVDVDGPVAECCVRVRAQVVLFNTTYMVGQILPIVDELRRAAPGCGVLVLSDPGMRGTLPPRRHAPQLSFLVKGIQIPVLAGWIRRIACGERVVDPQLEVAQLRMDKTVSTRELEILGLAMQGDSCADIAQRLSLSLGTVRNYISAAILKTGARNRLDAIRIVRRDGWLR
ncbi:response regulator transcription factor [Dactylosporangium cerinum]